MPIKRPIRKRPERITERRDAKVIPSLEYRPVLKAPKEYFFKKLNIFPIYNYNTQ